MMILRITLFLMCALFVVQAHALKEGDLDAGMVNPGYHEQPEWFKNSFLDIDEDVIDAKKNGKRLVLFFYQDGCPYCKKLFEDNLSQHTIAEKMRKNFDVVAINIWGDRDVTVAGKVSSEKKFAGQLKVMYTPTLLFLNEEGKPALRANGYYPPEKFNAALDYALGKQDKKETFSEYLARVSPKPASGKIHREVETSSPPYYFNKPLSHGRAYRLIMFEQKQCQPCDELHKDILQREASKELIRNFDVSVLDIWSDEKLVNAEGKAIKARDFAKQMNIQYAPSMVFFDNTGNQVFRVEAYLKAFHIQSAMDYVASGTYLKQPNFQRYIEARADALRAKGVEVDIMK